MEPDANPPPDPLLDTARSIVETGGAPEADVRHLARTALEDREDLLARLREAFSPLEDLPEGVLNRFTQVTSRLGRETVSSTFVDMYATQSDTRKAPVVGTTAVSTGRSKKRGRS